MSNPVGHGLRSYADAVIVDCGLELVARPISWLDVDETAPAGRLTHFGLAVERRVHGQRRSVSIGIRAPFAAHFAQGLHLASI